MFSFQKNKNQTSMHFKSKHLTKITNHHIREQPTMEQCCHLVATNINLTGGKLIFFFLNKWQCEVKSDLLV